METAQDSIRAVYDYFEPVFDAVFPDLLCLAVSNPGGTFLIEGRSANNKRFGYWIPIMDWQNLTEIERIKMQIDLIHKILDDGE